MKSILRSLAALTLLAACSSPELSGPTFRPRNEIRDAVHNNGNPRFFFLQPMVLANPANTGAFDADRDPVVTICRLQSNSCVGAPIATFSRNASSPSTRVTVDGASEKYQAQWHTRDFDLAEDGTYRVSITDSNVELGFADLVVVDKVTGKIKNSRTDEFVPIDSNYVLHIRFRIDQGIFPVRLEKISGDQQTAYAGTALAMPIVVRLTDASGYALANQAVNFSADGGGTAAGSVTTGADGIASSTWTLGLQVGTQGVAVHSLGGANASFTAVAIGEQLVFHDDFSNGLSKWQIRNVDGSGSWVTDNDELLGDYGIGCGSSGCHQTQILVNDEFQPGNRNWRIEVSSKQQVAFTGWLGGQRINEARFALWVSDTEKDIYTTGGNWINLSNPLPATWDKSYGIHQRYPWYVVGEALVTVPVWVPAAEQLATLTKLGNTYTLRFNGVQVYQTTHSYSAVPKVGLSAYGAIRMDDFKIFHVP